MSPLVTQLSWTDHLKIMSASKSQEERRFYVSGQFVTKSGADAYASIISVIQTARDNGENALKAIEKIMKK